MRMRKPIGIVLGLLITAVAASGGVAKAPGRVAKSEPAPGAAAEAPREAKAGKVEQKEDPSRKKQREQMERRSSARKAEMELIRKEAALALDLGLAEMKARREARQLAERKSPSGEPKAKEPAANAKPKKK